MKWVLSCLLALVLALSITPSVFAKETDSDTTICADANNGNDTQEKVGTTSESAEETEETDDGTTICEDEINGDDTQEEVGTTSDKAYKMLAAAVAPASIGNTIYVDANSGNDDQSGVGTASDKAYKTLAKAVAAAQSGDTIQLGEGNYTLYKVPSEGTPREKT